MHFTREPIIETIITPKDGHKLQVRSSKRDGGEIYTVDAIEVVSFGSSLFFRSLERPKSFILPLPDFEVIEVRESRVSLKNAQIEKSVKIDTTAEQPAAKKEKKEEKKRERKRKPKRRTTEESPTEEPKAEAESTEEAPIENVAASSAVLTQLFPPPSSLISDTISRFKAEEQAQNPPAEPKEETEEKKLDHIWTIDSDAKSEVTADDEPATDEEEITPPKKTPRRRVKKPQTEEKAEKAIEETPAAPSVIVDDPEKPKAD
ncbi:MAG: hypothetical protein MRY21_03090 [Simkaniaceae bacterium]|nr:hypothetical protein [Simkaniaceae bacterium]